MDLTLLAKHRARTRDQASLNSQLLKRQMELFHSGLDLQQEDPQYGQIIDESAAASDSNAIAQQFESNVYKLFKSNTQSANTFINMFPTHDYNKFNAIFPKMYSLFLMQKNIDALVVYNTAMKFISEYQTIRRVRAPAAPAAPAAPVAPTTAVLTTAASAPVVPPFAPSPPMGPQKAKKSKSKSKPSDPDNTRIKCTVPGCDGDVKKSNWAAHLKTEMHLNALQQLKADDPYGSYVFEMSGHSGKTNKQDGDY